MQRESRHHASVDTPTQSSRWSPLRLDSEESSDNVNIAYVAKKRDLVVRSCRNEEADGDLFRQHLVQHSICKHSWRHNGARVETEGSTAQQKSRQTDQHADSGTSSVVKQSPETLRSVLLVVPRCRLQSSGSPPHESLENRQ